MAPPFLPRLRFNLLRCWRTDRPAFCAGGVLVGAALAAGIVATQQYLLLSKSRQDVAQLQGMAAAATGRSAPSILILPPFQARGLLDALNGAAVAVALPVNEIVFAFDDNSARPYLRYTATVKVFGGYQAVRQFVDAVRERLPQSSLDAIACTRTDITSAHLSCDLTLTAFYQREPHV